MGRELLFRVTIKDCEVEQFRPSGAGGQHRDKTSNGVRIVHKPSGAVGQSSEDRSQARNKRTAFRRMGESAEFQQWAQARALGLRPIEEIVDELMAEHNLIVEEL